MAEVGKMFVTIGANTADFTKELKKVQKSWKELGESLTFTGRQITQVLTVPIAGLAAAVFGFSKEASAAFKYFGASVRESLGNVGTDIARTIDLQGILRDLSDVVKSVTDGFIALPDPVKKGIVVILALTATIGPLILVIAKLVLVIGALKGMFLGPFGIIVIAGLAAAGFVSFTLALANAGNESDKVKTKFEQILDVVKAITEIVAGLPMVFGGGSKAWGVMGGRIAGTSAGGQPAPGSEELYGPPLDESWAAAVKSNSAILDQYYSTLQNITEAEKLGLTTSTQAYEQRRDAEVQWLMAARKTKVQSDEFYAGEHKKILGMNDQIDSVGFKLRSMMEQIPTLATQVAQSIYNVFEAIATGIGNALAQIIVYGADVREMFLALVQQILASVIGMFVQIAIQQIISAIAGKAYAAALGASNIGVSVARAGAAGYAAAVESMGIFGLAAGPGIAAAAIAGASSAAVAGGAAGAGIGFGIGAAASGGIFTTPGITAIAERGEPEIVLNRGNIRQYFGGILGGNSVANVNLYLDGKRITRAVVPLMPAELMRQGVRT